MRNVIQSLPETVPFPLENGFGNGKLDDAIFVFPIVRQYLIQPPGRRSLYGLFNPFAVGNLVPGLMNHVINPCPHRLHHHLSSLPLQELEHVEIAIAFGRLRPEFSCNLHQGLYPGSIDFDGI